MTSMDYETSPAMTATEFRTLRDAANLTQQETSLLLLVAERTISAWETAENKIPRRKAEWIRSALQRAAKNRIGGNK